MLKTLRLSVITVAIGIATTTVAQAINSTIEQVTIYQGLASVSRSLPVNVNQINANQANGEQILVFSCLSPNIDENSISVQASQGINVGEISVEKLTGEQANICQYQADNAVRAQQSRLFDINAKIEAINLAKAYLQNLTKVSHINIEGNINDNVNAIYGKAAAINKQLFDLQKEQMQAQDDLDKLMSGHADFVTDSMTQISVRTASRTNGEVKLHYQVRGASWQPTYQAHLDTQTGDLSIRAFAIVAQQTGENWINIPLTLSTVNPNQNAKGSVPYVPKLNLYDNEMKGKRSNNSVYDSVEYMPVISMPAPAAANRATDSNYQAPLPSFSVSNQDKNGIIEYRLPQRINLPSDGRRVQTLIDKQEGKSEIWLRSTPEDDLSAYWYASVPFITPAWVDGSLQLYRDGNYIGQSNYAYQTLKEEGIGFGVDPNLIVTQLTDETNEGDAGVFNRNKSVSTTQAYQFTNQHDENVKLEVLGTEPIVQHDDIKLTTTHIPPVDEQNWNNNQGVVAWQFNLAPKASQKVRSTYQVVYPVDKELR